LQSADGFRSDWGAPAGAFSSDESEEKANGIKASSGRRIRNLARFFICAAQYASLAISHFAFCNFRPAPLCKIVL
jgi:hypothetical protein